MKTNKLRILIGSSLYLLASFCSQAQLTSSRLKDYLDVGVAVGSNGYMASLQFNEYLKLNKTNILQLGWGLRAAHNIANDLNFTSAPSRLANQAATTDTLQMGRATVTSLNFSLAVQVSLFERLALGISTDVLGLAIGSRRTGYYLGSNGFRSDSLNVHRTNQAAAPATGAIQLFGNQQRGNLNSEVYARVRVSTNFGIKVGYIFAVNEYKTNNTLLDDNRRFRARYNLLYVGVSILLAN